MRDKSKSTKPEQIETAVVEEPTAPSAPAELDLTAAAPPEETQETKPARQFWKEVTLQDSVRIKTSGELAYFVDPVAGALVGNQLANKWVTFPKHTKIQFVSYADITNTACAIAEYPLAGADGSVTTKRSGMVLRKACIEKILEAGGVQFAQ